VFADDDCAAAPLGSACGIAENTGTGGRGRASEENLARQQPKKK
jgi:hypothetical protein